MSRKTKTKVERDAKYKIDAVEKYARRIGAQQRNFRCYVVEEREQHSLYHHDKYVIRLNAEGEVTIREARGGDVPDDLQPKQEEKDAIKSAITGGAGVWPKTVHATKPLVDKLRSDLRKKLDGTEPILFVFRDAADEVLFVQQRIWSDNGEKSDLPWSYWDDQEWRCMEPDNSLPLFGLDRLKDASTVYVHEGAKTAHAVQRMCDVLNREVNDDTEQDHAAIATCPWIEELRHAAHVGWPAGAPNPHRVDWAPLRALSPHTSVVIVADNDRPGVDAVPKISRELKRRLSMVRFAKPFPPKFDLADPFPETFYEMRKGQKVFTGPSLDACTYPATWATFDKGLRTEFVEEWHSIIKPAVFINSVDVSRPPYDEAEFNALVAPFSDVSNVAALLRRQLSAQVDALAYEPGKPTGRISVDRQQAVNTYRPPSVKPAAGDVKLFEEYLHYLIPDTTDRERAARWVSTMIARPDIRMGYGMLLVSHVQGVGKTTLAEKILRPLVGSSNCSFPSPKEITDSQFTSWIAHKRLAVIAEVYAGQTSKAYNTLKNSMTDDYITVNEKYQQPYVLKNYIQVIASSNSFRALKLDDQDRRWLVPGVTEHKKAREFWVAFNEWVRTSEALAAIAAWAADYVKAKSAVEPGEHAPMSVAKAQAIDEARSDGERLIWQLGETLAALGKNTIRNGVVTKHGKRVVLRLDQIQTWLATNKAELNSREYGPEGRNKLESNDTIARLLRSPDLDLSLPKEQIRGNGRKFRIVANFPLPLKPKWEDLAPFWWKEIGNPIEM